MKKWIVFFVTALILAALMALARYLYPHNILPYIAAIIVGVFVWTFTIPFLRRFGFKNWKFINYFFVVNTTFIFSYLFGFLLSLK